MNIGIDLRLLGKRNGGIGRYSFEIAKHILEMDTENSYTLFFNEKNVDTSDMDFFRKFPNAKLIKTRARHYSVGEQTSFLKLINSFEFDMMHFPNFNVPIFYKRPFIVTIHDMVHHKISGAKKSHLLHFWAYKKIIEQAAKNAQTIITVSEYSKRDIVKYLNIPEDKIKVIYEAPSLEVNVAEEFLAQVKQQYLLTKPYFLFVGVLERKKNIVALTRAFDEFLKKYQVDMDLVIVGRSDPHYPDIRHHAMDITYKDHLIFTGSVDDKELAALYKGAYAFVSASLHEGFGLPGVEAMQFGLPLAVSNLEVFNEVYDNAAVYFDPESIQDIAEKLHIVSRDQQFHMQLQRKSAERGVHFSWHKAAAETIEVYNSRKV